MIPERQNHTMARMTSRRSSMHSSHPVFYRCESCGSISIEYGGCPFTGSKCGYSGTRLRLEMPGPDEEDRTHILSYAFFEGAQHNAVRISVGGGGHPMTEEHRIEWIYLLTYEGGQMKFLDTSLKAQVVFAMAGNDAYSYCDRSICRMGCEHYQFQCRRGWEVYTYCSLHGLRHLVLRPCDSKKIGRVKRHEKTVYPSHDRSSAA